MKVFLSYSHRDDALASKLAQALESEGIGVWYGGRDILPGDNWAEKIAKALADSDAIVVLLSRNALESPSVKREIEYALGVKDYRYRLIPVVVALFPASPSRVPSLFSVGRSGVTRESHGQGFHLYLTESSTPLWGWLVWLFVSLLFATQRIAPQTGVRYRH
jgi:TIR domain-containing protein